MEVTMDWRKELKLNAKKSDLNTDPYLAAQEHNKEIAKKINPKSQVNHSTTELEKDNGETNATPHFKSISPHEDIFSTRVEPIVELTNPTLEKIKYIETKQEFKKDMESLAIMVLAAFGLLSMVLTGNLPRIGSNFFLGIDLDSWWIFSKLLLACGFIAIPTTVLHLRGKSHFLDQIFSFLKPRTMSVKPWAMLSIAGLIISNLIFNIGMFQPNLFKTASEWRFLEKSHIDSRDPQLRAKFEEEKLMKAIPKALPALPIAKSELPVITPEQEKFIMEVNKIESLMNSQNGSPYLSEQEKQLIKKNNDDYEKLIHNLTLKQKQILDKDQYEKILHEIVKETQLQKELSATKK
jgi:hypothetical protein